MADIIVVLIVIVLLGFALRGAIRHFKGDSPCCGGGTGIIKTDDKELKNPVIGKKTVHIEGMTCEHCVQSVKKVFRQEWTYRRKKQWCLMTVRLQMMF